MIRGDSSKIVGDFNRAKPKVKAAADSLGRSAAVPLGGGGGVSAFGAAGAGAAAGAAGAGAAAGAAGAGALARGGPALAAAMATGAVFVKTARSGEMYNRAMRSSLAIMGDVSKMMRGEMREAAVDAAATTQFSMEQTAESFYFLASAGLDVGQSIAALPQVALFAQAGMFDMARATDLATDAQSALGMTVKDPIQNLENLKRVTDALVGANTLANASVEQFSTALTTKAGAALKMTNKSLEEGLAILAVFADQGLKSSEAGTALNIVLRDLQTKALRNSAAFEEMGVNIFDSENNMRHMADILKDLEKLMEGKATADKKAALMQLGFADKSLIFTQMLIGSSEALKGYNEQLDNMAGKTEEVAEKQLTALQKGLAGAGAGFTALGSTIMKVLGPVLEYTLKFIGNLAQGAATFHEIFGEMKEMAERQLGLSKATEEVAGVFKCLNVEIVKTKKNTMELIRVASRVTEGLGSNYKENTRLALSYQEAKDSMRYLTDEYAILTGRTTEAKLEYEDFIESLEKRGLSKEKIREYGDEFVYVRDGIKKIRLREELGESLKGVKETFRDMREEIALATGEMTKSELAALQYSRTLDQRLGKQTLERIKDRFRNMKDEMRAIEVRKVITGLEKQLETAPVRQFGRVGFVEFADKLQQSLSEEDPQKKMLDELKEHKRILAQIERNSKPEHGIEEEVLL